MKKIVVFGNSGSGKSTLAKSLCSPEGLAPLDLDTLAWKPTSPPERKPLNESKREIEDFLTLNSEWITQYAERDDTFSRSARQTLYESYMGKKTMYTSNERDA